VTGKNRIFLYGGISRKLISHEVQSGDISFPFKGKVGMGMGLTEGFNIFIVLR